MSTFSTLLGTTIKTNNLSVYSLAKDIECGRTWLQKVISGERHMDYRNFIALYRKLKNYIGSNELNKLYESFVYDYYGDKEYSMIMYIRDRLYETKELEEDIKKNYHMHFDISEYIKKNDLNECESNIACSAFEIIEGELKYGKNNNESPKLYINIPSNWKYLKNLILILLNNKEVKDTKNFKYITNCKFKDSMDKIQIENFLTASEFASYGYNTFEGDAIIGHQLSYNTIFPYYIITGKRAVLITEDGKTIIENSDEDILEKIGDTLEKIILEKKSFLEEVNPETYSSVIMDGSINGASEFFEIANGINVSRFYTKKILQKIISSDYPDKDFMVETLARFCEKSRNTVAFTYFTIDSVKHFMETDESKDEGGYFNLQLTDELKIDLVKKIHYYYSNSEGEIHMLKAGKYLASDGIHIFGWAEKVICAANYIYNKGNRIDAIAVISSPLIAKHMKNYSLYMMNSGICLDKQNSLDVLGNLIKAYEEKINNSYIKNSSIHLDLGNSLSVLSRLLSVYDKTRGELKQ